MVAQLVAKDLCLGYEGKAILKNLNFTVQAGDCLCILGENGAGKSTLMKTLLGLHPAMGGSIEMGDGMKAGDIGYLPQQTAVQRDFPASVWEIVLSGCQGRCGLRPFYNKAEKQLAAQNLKKMGAEHLARRCYRELSGGQQQRVLLARALCATQKLLLLDEPVSGLDPSAAADLYQLIQQVNREGVTVVMISHDLDAALECASHVLHLGKQVFFGTRQEYLASGMAQNFADRKEGR